MNAGQRKELSFIIRALTSIDPVKMSVEDITVAVEAAESDVGNIAEEERDKFDNLNEGLQAGERGQALEEAADTLEGIDWPDVGDYDLTTEEGREEFGNAIGEVVDVLEGL